MPRRPRIGADIEAFVVRMAPVVARAHRFSGWTFDDLKVSYPDGREPWSYDLLACERATLARRVLDLGTGGGERFAAIRGGPRSGAVASEEWGANAIVACARLKALGVPVVHCTSELTPFRPASFDLVLSRHEAIDPADRILAPGGVFLTQQVRPDHWHELRGFMPRKTLFPRHDESYPDWFRGHGYAVEFRGHNFPAAYTTLEDVVFMLLIAPWEVPDFDVRRDAEALLELERALAGPAGIVLSDGLYLLEARKPA